MRNERQIKRTENKERETEKKKKRKRQKREKTEKEQRKEKKENEKRGGEKRAKDKRNTEKEKRKRKDTEHDKRKQKEIATIFVENLKTLHKILTVLQFYQGNLKFFIIFHHSNGKFFMFHFISDFISFLDCFRVTNFFGDGINFYKQVFSH